MGKFKLNYSGVRELLNGEDIRNVCMQFAEEVASTAGEGHEASTFKGFDRIHGSVKAVSESAQQKTLDDNHLLKAAGK
jgi:hypothetical protein